MIKKPDFKERQYNKSKEDDYQWCKKSVDGLWEIFYWPTHEWKFSLFNLETYVVGVASTENWNDLFNDYKEQLKKYIKKYTDNLNKLENEEQTCTATNN